MFIFYFIYLFIILLFEATCLKNLICIIKKHILITSAKTLYEAGEHDKHLVPA